MRKMLNVSLVGISIIIMILSSAFIFIEGRNILSFEFTIYHNPFNGFIRYLFRFILSLFAFVVCFYQIKERKNNEYKIKEYLMYGSISLVLMSIVISFFSSNYVGLVLVILSSLFLLNKLLLIKVK